jgi:hypothetical protein
MTVSSLSDYAISQISLGSVNFDETTGLPTKAFFT